jgi:hypothetical protein
VIEGIADLRRGDRQGRNVGLLEGESHLTLSNVADV